MSLFGWCHTGHHEPINPDEFVKGLCPGSFKSAGATLTCDCSCHRGDTTLVRRRPYNPAAVVDVEPDKDLNAA